MESVIKLGLDVLRRVQRPPILFLPQTHPHCPAMAQQWGAGQPGYQYPAQTGFGGNIGGQFQPGFGGGLAPQPTGFPGQRPFQQPQQTGFLGGLHFATRLLPVPPGSAATLGILGVGR